MTTTECEISLTVNGEAVREAVPPRLLLGDFLRERAGIAGTHFGCEQGVCGTCTVLLDGESVRSCLLFAVQADGCEVATVESLASDGQLHRLQTLFKKHHALQCGYCTPGMLMTALDLLANRPPASEADIRDGIRGNLCRCTGYQNIVAALMEAAGLEKADGAGA
ncbi:MAG: (2Fe-2S)-binding protein [Acidimicrobiia bacterium]|nr:(2Fe-2S)-binding protein [Gammaproteobacteria bacterium]MYJ13734.1 (2Fe-2S)-binding protein [Acidimicrobiia bacterium]